MIVVRPKANNKKTVSNQSGVGIMNDD